MGILQEFKEFAVKGNFVDLAVAVVLGAASGKVVTAIVEKIIMPPVGIALGQVNFSDLKIVLKPGSLGADGKELVKEVAIGYGATIQALVDFVIVAFIIFLIVKAMNKFKKATPPPEPSAQEKLLMEIRDALKAAK
ncbi:Large-conductance mechanosensitive channel [Labilithrix luteola]|uniref:Large-conductance mechanosensitive channel n=1 Tax=Labilithrix luteola TaxID=1391654 RepID=A0A0K1PTN9_9BACT|nr:large-conductance mechanosensitive channel protein MscL [Labilithrix luteola]AKU96499.1 Large-conductance mechanosensitive channel [Labilithrix luteola]